MQILLVVALINVFVIVLCGLISLSDRFFNQTGKANIAINGKTAGEVECGQSLFSALTQTGVFLPAACGGKGTCGRCQVKVTGGDGPLMPLEQLNLTSEQIAAAMRLACQVKVRQNIELTVSDELLNAQNYVVELVSAETVAESVKTLVFKLREGESLHFKPGQYMQVFYQLPWEKAIRAYSLSSDPRVEQSFSLDVQRVEGGLMSTYLHQLQTGQQIEVCGPFGEMFLDPEATAQPVVLVAGGVGLAPMRSMLASLLHGGFTQPVMLFHGVRSRKNLYYEEYYRELARQFPRFSYVPALSNPMIEEGWTGARGMVHQVLEQQLQPAAFTAAYVCGPAPMMQAVTRVLVAKGLPESRIFTDPFDF